MSGVAYKTGVTVSSSTQDDIAPGLLTGHVRTEPDGSKYMLLKAAGAITNGDCVKKDTTTSSEITVIVTASSTADITLAVDNRGSATALASGDYFWGKCYGRGYIDPDATGWADGAILTGGASGKGDVLAIGAGRAFAIAISDDDATDTLAGEAANHVWIMG